MGGAKVASEAEGLVEMMAASCREMVGGEEEVVVKERREEGIPGSALMMACSTGPHICTEKVSSGVTLVG